METKLYLFMLAVYLSVLDCYDLASFRDTLESKELNPATDSDDISTGPVVSDSETDEEGPVLNNKQPDVRALRHRKCYLLLQKNDVSYLNLISFYFIAGIYSTIFRDLWMYILFGNRHRRDFNLFTSNSPI